MWTITSPPSTSTQSQCGRPSIPRLAEAGFAQVAFASWSATAPTWRCERPEVTTMWSESEDLPVMSMATVCSALASSRLLQDDDRSFGVRGLRPRRALCRLGRGRHQQCPSAHARSAWVMRLSAVLVADRERFESRRDKRLRSIPVPVAVDHTLPICASHVTVQVARSGIRSIWITLCLGRRGSRSTIAATSCRGGRPRPAARASARTSASVSSEPVASRAPSRPWRPGARSGAGAGVDRHRQQSGDVSQRSQRSKSRRLSAPMIQTKLSAAAARRRGSSSVS